jgi:Fe-S cluster assembly iron-binding protein IscA
MLALTDEATEAIEGLLSNPGMPEGAGVRIASSAPATDGGASTGLEVALATEPDNGDEVIEEAGARVFLEDTVAELLDDKLLDVDRSGDQVRFSLGTQP